MIGPPVRGYRIMAGSVRKIGSVWYIRYNEPVKPGGKRKQRELACKGVTRKRDAEAILAKIQTDIANGQYRDPKSRLEPEPEPEPQFTFADQLHQWLEDRERRKGLSPSTIEGYQVNIRCHIVPGLGDIPLEDLRAFHIRDFYGELQDAGLSPKTIRNVHGIVHCALEDACDMERIAGNPAGRVKPPAAQRPEIIIADDNELAKIHTAIEGSKYRICVLLAMSAGLRRGEIVALQWRDLNPESGALIIRRAAVQVAGKDVTIKSTKSGKDRIVVLPATMLEELETHRVEQVRMKEACGLKHAAKDWICAEADGTAFTPKGLASDFYRLSKKYGVEVTLHGLRHTFVTEQLAAGVTSEIVQKRSGHATMAFMHDRYGHAQPQHQEAAVAVSERLLHPKVNIKVI
jgi:integrase